MKEKARIRVGKTVKDHKTGAWSNRFANRAARVSWQQDTNRNAVFPRQACNGKANRHRWTGKKGVVIVS